jgi:glycosyltransferase involved in cell wall biosynthesis
MLASEELRTTMGIRARERVATEFTFDKQAERYAALFDRLLAQTNRRPVAGAR